MSPGLRAGLILSLALLSASTAVAGLRDVRVAGDAAVRSWAARNAPAVEVVRSGGFVTLEGTVQAPWYRVRTTTGRVGWVAGTIADGLLTADEGLATKPTQLTGSLRLLTAAELRGGPVLGRPVQHELSPGSIVRVLDQYGTWVLLGDSQGRSGWCEVSTFVASAVEDGSVPVPAPEARVADKGSERRGQRAEAGRDEPEAEVAATEDEAAGPTGAELRELRLQERRAAREAAQAEDDDAAAERAAAKEARRLEIEQRKAERAAKRAEAEAEAEAKAAAKEAERLARNAEAEAAEARAESEVAAAQESPVEDAEAQREARDAERRAAREAKDAERRAARQAREAERQAAREAKEAEKRASLEAKRMEEEPSTDEPAAEEAVDVAELKRQERAAAAARREEERAAAAARKEQERAAEEAEKQAAREAKEAERLARKEAKQREDEAPVRAAAPVIEVQEVPTGPVAPADIPPSLGVSLDKKAPAEKKPDPARSPLASEVFTARRDSALPVLDSPSEASRVPADAAAAELLEGFKPYDESTQVDRSVEAVHDDSQEALDLSFAKRPSARSSSFYVNDEGDMVDTRIVSEIVLRVGSEILTLGEFERRVEESREGEQVRSGQMPSLDQARRRVLAELVDSLVLVHHGRAIGIRFDAVYESAKEDFKKSGRITDDLELLKLLDEMGMTFKDFRREMIRRTVPQIVVRTQIMNDVTVAEEEIDNYYRRHQDEWVQEDCVNLRELVLQPEARETTRDFNLRLEEILKRVEAGEDFCDLARRHSRSASAAECGRLEDCFSFDQLDEKVARVVFKMRPGDLEPIRTDWGYHLLRLEEHRPRRVRSLEEVRGAILRKLQLEKMGNEVPRFLEELRRTVRIEISPAFQRYWSDSNARGGLGQ